MSVFSERLHHLRKSKKVSQVALAKEIGVSSRVYQDYEYGKREAQMTTLIRMADFFDVSLDYLTGRTDTP
ncbi:XRE family transcriptional regulator [Colidextribacter sp. OB.20]|uniref:helix-turn-helix domain-containing protein n=1 Tax=Colidextribacter sp. OB.20 TaxID=2304568 RepID=UPI001368E64A|nr:helix-turn-helix transcriptional regulator [Colidextribacter sp. OB.20]NBI09409.1 XRE family transcriptional regulator [Colidextribacter sp. OB.20]